MSLAGLAFQLAIALLRWLASRNAPEAARAQQALKAVEDEHGRIADAQAARDAALADFDERERMRQLQGDTGATDAPTERSGGE